MIRPRSLRHLSALSAAVCFVTMAVGPTSGHNGVKHTKKPASQGATTAKTTASSFDDTDERTPFPTGIGGNFDLIDQTGKRRQLKDFAGQPLAIFFGYATCQAICSVALPRMAEMVDKLGNRDISVLPVLITVDPKRDTPDAMRKMLPKYHERLVGLTGSRAEIDRAKKAFQVESKVVYTDPDGGDIFAHGSFIYLMDEKGKFLTLFPPILGPDRMSKIAEKYLKKPQS